MSAASTANHHLRRKTSGLWQMRLALLDKGTKCVGRRVVIGLGTHDVEEARARRDLVLRAVGVCHAVARSYALPKGGDHSGR